MDEAIISFIVFSALLLLPVIIYISNHYKKRKRVIERIEADELLYDSDTGKKFSYDEGGLKYSLIPKVIKTEDTLKELFDEDVINIERCKNYLRTKGFKSYLYTREDNFILTKLNWWESYLQYNPCIIFEIKSNVFLYFLEVEYRLNSEKFKDTQLMLWIKNKQLKSQFLIDNLKSEKRFSYIREEENHFFKSNRNANIEDLRKFLQEN